MSNGKISVSESFEKETEVVVVFAGKDKYERDCDSLRNILGKAFPKLLEMKEKQELAGMDKWLMRKSSYDGSIQKKKNLSSLERELRDDGILLNLKYVDKEMIQEFPREIERYENSIRTYLESSNERINELYIKYRNDSLISGLDVKFSTSTTNIYDSEGNIAVSGNYFTVRTVSEKGEEALKLCHKEIVKTLLEVLDEIDDISMVRYKCGDIEHEVKSKIACVLD